MNKDKIIKDLKEQIENQAEIIRKQSNKIIPENLDLHNRINKAIELIKNECLDTDGNYCCDLWGDNIYKLLSILRGEDNE